MARKVLLLLLVFGGVDLGRSARGAAEKSDGSRMESRRSAERKWQVRNNSASLLYQLLNDEKNVSKVLIIKRESDDLHALVKHISGVAGEAVKELEALAARDRGLDLHDRGLPPGEMAAREAESKTREGELLHSKGREFEFKLLLTQAEALVYGTHLARVAAENESNPDRARVFASISAQLQELASRVEAQLHRTQ